MAAHLKDLTGMRKGRLTVIRRAGTYYPPYSKEGTQPTWECLCDCGNTVVVNRTSLTHGRTYSCGCLVRDMAKRGLGGPRIPVLQFDLNGKRIQRFGSIIEAERVTGVSHQTISECCRGKRETAGGFIWKKETDHAD